MSECAILIVEIDSIYLLVEKGTDIEDPYFEYTYKEVYGKWQIKKSFAKTARQNFYLPKANKLFIKKKDSQTNQFVALHVVKHVRPTNLTDK